MMRDKIEVYTQEQKVKIQSGELASSRSGEIYKFGVREFDPNGLLKSASAIGEISEEKINSQLEASELLGFSGKDQLPRSNQTREWNYINGSFSSLEQLSALTADILEKTKKKIPHFIIQGYGKEIQEEVTYSNSLGACLKKKVKNHELVFDLRRRGSPNICDAYFFFNSFEGFNCEAQLDLTLSLLEAFDKEVEIKPGRHKTLMPPDMTMISKVGESLRADKYNEGSALFSGRLGQNIFGPTVSFKDCRDAVEFGGASPFDYEGEIAKADKTSLIQEGRFIGLISDLRNERKYGVPSTANGFRKYNSQVNLNFASLRLENGKRSVSDILHSQEEVIVPLLAFGGDLTEEGNFSTPIQLAFLVRDGKPVGQIKNLALSTSLDQFFGEDLIEISNTSSAGGGSNPYCLAHVEIQRT